MGQGVIFDVIASAAKQSSAAETKWIASSHPPSPEGGLRRTRVLLAMTVRMDTRKETKWQTT
jgi:hypothetical protein